MCPIAKLKNIESGFRRELAELCKTSAEKLPVSLPAEISMQFLGVTNRETLHVWKSTKRHGLVWIKRGRVVEIETESAIAHRLQNVIIPADAA